MIKLPHKNLLLFIWKMLFGDNSKYRFIIFRITINENGGYSDMITNIPDDKFVGEILQEQVNKILLRNPPN